MDINAINDLMAALQKAFKSEETGEVEKKPKHHSVTIVSMGQGKKFPDSLKIPKDKKAAGSDNKS